MKTYTLQLTTLLIITLINLNEANSSTIQRLPDEMEYKINRFWNTTTWFPPAQVEFTDEEYINDLSFNTKCITDDCRLEKALAIDFNLPEENYVDDIPFDTRQIAEQVNSKEAANVVFDFEDEVFINDIPFDTREVVLTFESRNNLVSN